jgi:hypothetical protein
VRSFAIGLILLVLVSVSVLSLRPGGLRRQLKNAARRLRLALVLGGIYVVVSAALRLAVQEGPVLDYGLPLLAIALAAVFIIAGRDPATEFRP